MSKLSERYSDIIQSVIYTGTPGTDDEYCKHCGAPDERK